MSRYNAETWSGRHNDTVQEVCDTAEGTRHDAHCARGKGQAYDTEGQACYTVGHRLRHDRPGCSARGLCAQLSLGVHLVHPTQFWTQCIVSDSLFGTLFMNTVHEHCSRSFF